MPKITMVNKEGHEISVEPVDAKELASSGYWEKGKEKKEEAPKEVKKRGRKPKDTDDA